MNYYLALAIFILILVFVVTIKILLAELKYQKQVNKNWKEQCKRLFEEQK